MKEEWKKVKLGELCEITSSKRFHLSERTTSGIPFYCTKEILLKLKGEENFECDYIAEKFYEEIKTKFGVPESGDLLLTTRGTVGYPYLYRKTDKFYFADGNLSWFKNFSEKLDSHFLYYWFLSVDGKSKVDSIAKGTAQKAVPITGLGILDITLPSLPTQQKIASILSAYDDLIENNRKQIKLLEEAAQKLYKEWFVKLNFPGHETTKIVDGIPEGWKKDSILSFEFFKQTNPSVKNFEGEKKYYATADVNGTFLNGVGEVITFRKRPSRASIQPCENSVWFARMSNSYKILCYFGESSKLVKSSIISSGFAGFYADKKYFGFIYNTISSNYFDNEKNRFATGETQVSLTNEGLRKIEILVPTEELLIKYSKITNSYIEKCEILKSQIQQLQSARDKLLPKLMNGEIEV